MSPRPLALLLLLPLAPLAADAIKLKSGEVVEGRILRNDDAGVLVEVQFSPTITEQRLIPKKDIDLSVVASPDEAAYAEIARLKLPETATEVAPYDQTLTGKLRPFLKDHPKSERVADVKTLIATYEAERKRILAGNVKVAGVWYDASAYAAEKYQIDAERAWLAMQADIAAKNYPAALNAFDGLRRNFPNSAAYAESVAPARDALAKFETQLRFAASNLPQVLAQRQAAIDRTPAERRPAVEQAIAAENARADAILEAARQANRSFVPVLPYDEKGIKAMQESAANLSRDLALVDEKKLTAGARLIRLAQKEIARNELDAAATTLAKLQTTWPEYEGLSRLQERARLARTANAASNSEL